MSQSDVYSLVLCLLLFVLMTGCSDGKLEVTGAVCYEGQYPEEGTIAFISDSGAGITYGGPYAKGQYKVRVPEGTFLVRITGWRIVPLDSPLPSVMGRPPVTEREETIIPNVYGLHSKLQVEINKSARKLNFDLKTPEK